MRVKKVSKRFGNKFDYFKKYKILCKSEDTVKFCRKFARNRCITTLYSSTAKILQEFSLCPQIGSWPKCGRLRKHGLGFVFIKKTTLFRVNCIYFCLHKLQIYAMLKKSIGLFSSFLAYFPRYLRRKKIT